MIKPDLFFKELSKADINFFTGVPDSLLKNFISYISENSSNHIIAANEGSAVGLAIGHHLATGQIPLIYLQNSGLGNAINPLISLADKLVYSIPLLLVIGWRGEPGTEDEPQHRKQGQITTKLLEIMDIDYVVLDKNTDLSKIISLINKSKKHSSPVAILVKKNTFESYAGKKLDSNIFQCTREEVIKMITECAKKKTIIVSSTGMISRELYETQREENNLDFLTVGGMGHASQIALGIAKEKLDNEVICIDGDGSAIMHLGALLTSGSKKLKNYKHFLINNGVHGSVGNQDTYALDIDFSRIADIFGYLNSGSSNNKDHILKAIRRTIEYQDSAFLEIKVNTNFRENLGRPKSSPLENKNTLMKSLLK
ncbi:phosphonopyruvate decarboxylase [Pelagibacteraceae bacterium]|nr:phosphonopyruvate decarboxylase [Pelagibacteraceae bacterium]